MQAARQPRNPGVAVEANDAPPRLFGYLAGGLVALVAVSLVALWLIYPSATSIPSDAPRGEIAKPRLQINSAADLAAHRQPEQQALTSFGWIDRERGVVRIPIDQAMRDVAAAGIKDWPQGAR